MRAEEEIPDVLTPTLIGKENYNLSQQMHLKYGSCHSH